ncbi:hypothetical protein AB0368_35960 [Actinoplanes sp. NPDC051475]|uniref:hypothetical protein n=1 Tax=Actinoplanes sp. NPDC051475 TaxID=3157225 RepID=UPI0034505A8C
MLRTTGAKWATRQRTSTFSIASGANPAEHHAGKIVSYTPTPLSNMDADVVRYHRKNARAERSTVPSFGDRALARRSVADYAASPIGGLAERIAANLDA